MLDVYLLGTGGMLPLPERHLTACIVRYRGTSVLIDCGEGTQVAIRRAGTGFKQIGVILLTHFHADHIAGLPGLLLTIGNSGREEPVTIIGPKHVGRVVDCLRIIAPQLPFEIIYREIPKEGGEILRIEELVLAAHPVEHWIACYAYRFDLPRQGRFDAGAAKALDVPVQLWSTLQRGETVAVGGREVRPEEVLGPPRQGLRVAYSTDLRPADSLAQFAAGADLWICEGNYGDPALYDKAVEHRHCLFSEAAGMAKAAGVRELWLTHFSPAMPNPAEFLPVATEIFPHTYIDKRHTELRFAD